MRLMLEPLEMKVKAREPHKHGYDSYLHHSFKSIPPLLPMC